MREIKSFIICKSFFYFFVFNTTKKQLTNNVCTPGGSKKAHLNFNLEFLVNHRFLLRRILYTEYTFCLKSFLKFCERLILKTTKYGMLQKTCDFHFV